MSYTETKIVCLTSQSATIKKNDSYLSNVRYSLATILKNDPNIIHKQVQLLNAQIPYSFYVINYTNNIFKIKIGSSSINTLIIPVGNYTSTSLISQILTSVGDSNFSITISNINGRLTFSHTTDDFIIYNDFTYSISSVLGFDNNSINTSVSNTLTALYPLNLLGIKTLQIRSANLIMENISSIEGGQTILLSSIPVDAVPFGMLNYTDKGNLITIYNTDLDDLDIDIIDGESGNYINFNNQDWCITLAFHITKTITTNNGSKNFKEVKTISTELQKNLDDLNLLSE